MRNRYGLITSISVEIPLPGLPLADDLLSDSDLFARLSKSCSTLSDSVATALNTSSTIWVYIPS
jgi:hypothetical protein